VLRQRTKTLSAREGDGHGRNGSWPIARQNHTHLSIRLHSGKLLFFIPEVPISNAGPVLSFPRVPSYCHMILVTIDGVRIGNQIF
jgi:hypothetical protein